MVSPIGESPSTSVWKFFSSVILSYYLLKSVVLPLLLILGLVCRSLAKKRNILLKLGGSVITYKGAKNFPLNSSEIWKNVTNFINVKTIKRISSEIRECLSDLGYLIIVHGAGVFGHYPVSKFLKSDASEQLAFGWPLTLYSVGLENLVLQNQMLSERIPVVSVAPRSMFTVTARDTDHPWVGVDASFDCTIIRRLLTHYIPVLFGDLTFDQKGEPAVLSGDTILYLCARELRDVDLVIAGTDVQGIFTDDPKQNPNARFLEEVTLSEKNEISLKESSHHDVDGGMLRKFKELASIAKLGVPSMVIDASVKGNISKALRGEHVGTLVRP
jgi:isopentenyl phosphate kinase